MAKPKSRNTYGGYKGGRTSAAASRGPKKPPLTHFLCFPLVTSVSRPQLEQSLQHFQTLALNGTLPFRTSPDASGDSVPFEAQLPVDNRSPSRLALPTKAIRPLGTLHLTLGVMSLETEDQMQGATSLLRSLDVRSLLEDAVRDPEAEPDVAGVKDTEETRSAGSASSTSPAITEETLRSLQQPVSPPPTSRPSVLSSSAQDPMVISLLSLISMHTPTSTSILYAAPQDPTNRLLRLGNRIRSTFEDNGYMVKDTRPLKLHATIVNTIYAKPGGRFENAGRNFAQSSKSKQKDTQEQETATDLPNSSEQTNNDVGEANPPDKASRMRHSARGPLRIDATAVIEQFRGFTWANDFRIEKIAICKMGAKTITNEQGDVVGEEYEEVASIPLP